MDFYSWMSKYDKGWVINQDGWIDMGHNYQAQGSDKVICRVLEDVIRTEYPGAKVEYHYDSWGADIIFCYWQGKRGWVLPYMINTLTWPHDRDDWRYGWSILIKNLPEEGPVEYDEEGWKWHEYFQSNYGLKECVKSLTTWRNYNDTK